MGKTCSIPDFASGKFGEREETAQLHLDCRTEPATVPDKGEAAVVRLACSGVSNFSMLFANCEL